MVDITYDVNMYREYSDSLMPTTYAELGSDRPYFTLVKSVREAEKFNYHSDYWGSADEYQRENTEVIEALKPFIGKTVMLDGETGKFMGLLIDRQYNSVNHTRILLEP